MYSYNIIMYSYIYSVITTTFKPSASQLPSSGDFTTPYICKYICILYVYTYTHTYTPKTDTYVDMKLQESQLLVFNYILLFITKSTYKLGLQPLCTFINLLHCEHTLQKGCQLQHQCSAPSVSPSLTHFLV